MKLQTKVNIDKMGVLIRPDSKMCFLGSCFATHIGTRMIEVGLNAHVNPFGVLYNPISVAVACDLMSGRHTISKDSFFEDNGMWHSWLNDSSFSFESLESALANVEKVCRKEHERLKTLDYLFITLGTNRYYELIDSGLVVSNCHKQPDRNFVEKQMTVDEVVNVLQQSLNKLWSVSPFLKVVITVSPYRYAKYGFHESQLGKAVLLLAVDELCRRNQCKCMYFPAYEILLDELRDYRFYAEDMLHPSDVAVNYIWEKFKEVCFSERTIDYMSQWLNIRKALSHRPLHPESEAYQKFKEKTIAELKQLKEKYPHVEELTTYQVFE